jgi:hypothetical protein
MRRVAATIALIGLFVLAFVGWYNGVSPETCALKALIGAVILYVVVKIVGEWVASMVADAYVDSASGQNNEGGSSGEARK